LSDWRFAQENASDELCQLHHFSMKHEGSDFLITVREYITPPDPAMKFFAYADKQTNQRVGAYTPTGWGNTLLTALAECMRSVRRFPYQPDR
jgi:hypothetical protein